MPIPSRKRGRHKGNNLTVIGLPKKKKKSNRPTPFIKKHTLDKKKDILKWLSSKDIADKVFSYGYQVTCEDINETMPVALLDENVFVPSVQRYFERSAWKKVEDILKRMRNDTEWFCEKCKMHLGSESIACDHCFLWYDLACVGLRKPPKEKVCICRECCRSQACM